jgi:hypothetical protein
MTTKLHGTTAGIDRALDRVAGTVAIGALQLAAALEAPRGLVWFVAGDARVETADARYDWLRRRA